MNCQKCGQPVGEGTKLCGKCGAQTTGESLTARHSATIWQRLVNYLIDRVGYGILAVIFIGIFVGVTFLFSGQGYSARTTFFIAWLLLIVAYPAYYIFFETIWQRTPGKWASDTKVVCLDGSKPKFWRIVGRTFARLIPFEQFSYLFGEYPYGWHDQITKTMVVPAEYTPEEIAQINPREKGKTHPIAVVIGTVVILLFIIAIVGVFSSVVLVSLDTARARAYDAGVRAALIQMRSNYIASDPGVEGGAINFCNDPQMIATLNKFLTTQYQCFNNENHWALSVKLKTEPGHWCVDDVSLGGRVQPKAISSFSCDTE